jgi:UDP-N-acetylglucosamine--N-acetylmuramyl-(pentapeptide) pyrophosphoryl-undecaprenol N-acetylglucosamine transferase
MSDAQEKTIRVLMASGGTGGHVFPGVHIADALKAAGPVEITFVGVGRPTEERIITGAGYEHRVVKTVGLKGRGLKGIVGFFLSIPKALLETRTLFEEKQPDIVIATGGYPSFFPVIMACFCRIPRWLHEAERRPGLANTVLSLFASKISLAFEDAAMPFWARTIYTGHPVRSALTNARKEVPERTVPERVLILGGSQGAGALDKSAEALATLYKENGIEVWHQCRAGNEEMVQGFYDAAGVTARVMSFIDSVDEAYEWSDLIIARSGAGTVSEIAVVNRPAIFVPFPFAQGNHQEANARLLVDQEKALLVKEGDDFDKRLLGAVKDLLVGETYCAMYRKEAEVSGIGAAALIARFAKNLIAR